MLQAMDDRHWLIWTSRPAPLRAGLRRDPPRARRRALPAAGRGAGRRRRARRGREGADPVPPRPGPRLPRDARDSVRARARPRIVWHPALHARADPPFGADRLRARWRPRRRPLPDDRRGGLRRPTEAMTPPPRAGTRAAGAAAGDARLPARAGGRARPGPHRRRHARRRRCSGRPAELVDRLADHFLRVVPPASVGLGAPELARPADRASSPATPRPAWRSCARCGARRRAGGAVGRRRRERRAAPAAAVGPTPTGTRSPTGSRTSCRSSTTWTRAGCCTDSTRR